MNKYRRALREALREDQSSWDELNDYTFEEEQAKYNPRGRVRQHAGDFTELFEAAFDIDPDSGYCEEFEDEMLMDNKPFFGYDPSEEFGPMKESRRLSEKAQSVIVAAIADEFGLDDELADFYVDAAISCANAQDFMDEIIMADEDENGLYFGEVAIPYAEAKNLFRAIKLKLTK